jgi:NAD(P)H dehydrogenase (quinone)
MPQPKVAVIYYSATGNVHGLATAIAEGAEKAGAEVRLRKVAETVPAEIVASREDWARHVEETSDIPAPGADDLIWADAVIFGTPTRFGNVTAQLKGFLDSLGPQWQQGQLANKVYSGFTSASTVHGGQESTLLALYTTIHHFGGFVVAPGYTDPIQFATGTPYGSTNTSGAGPLSDQDKAAATFQGGRVAKIAAALIGADLSL